MSGVATAIIGSAVVGAGASYLGSKAQADAAEAATEAQTEASDENIQFQREMFDQQREDNAPWREIGEQSLQKLKSGMDAGAYDVNMRDFDFKADPGYKFRMREGVNALDASASARGRLNSGAQQKALTQYGQNVASQEFGNAFNRQRAVKSDRFNRMATLSGIGQAATSADQNARTNMTTNVGNSLVRTGDNIARGQYNQGNARASAYQGAAQSINQGAQNFLIYDQLG